MHTHCDYGVFTWRAGFLKFMAGAYARLEADNNNNDTDSCTCSTVSIVYTPPRRHAII